MLRKNPAASAASPARGGRTLRSIDHDNEKGSKMKRNKESQTKAIFFCLGVLALLGLIAKVEVNHLHKFTSKRLRKRSHHHHVDVAREMEEKAPDSRGDAVDFHPPHSIYNLEIEDIYGKMINTSKFRGMVTLIVNVACN